MLKNRGMQLVPYLKPLKIKDFLIMYVLKMAWFRHVRSHWFSLYKNLLLVNSLFIKTVFFIFMSIYFSIDSLSNISLKWFWKVPLLSFTYITIPKYIDSPVLGNQVISLCESDPLRLIGLNGLSWCFALSGANRLILF